jgi:SAM-dependent methyltransferase
VLAGFVIFFLPDPVAAVRAYARVLRPGGRLALSTCGEPTEQETMSVRKLSAALAAFLPARPPAAAGETPPEQRQRTRESIRDLLDAAGFTDLKAWCAVRHEQPGALSAVVLTADLIALLSTHPNESDEPVLQDTYDWAAIKAHAGDVYFVNSPDDPYGCGDEQGRALFDRLGGTQIVRNDGHFGDYDQPDDTFPLLDRLID